MFRTNSAGSGSDNVSGAMGRHVSRRTLVGAGMAGALSMALPVTPPRFAGAEGAGDWRDLLELTPDPAVWSDEPSIELFTATDIALQLDTLGLSSFESRDDEHFDGWIAATFGLAFPGMITGKAMHPDFDQFLGWHVGQMDQILESIILPEGVTVVRGRFDEETVQAAWREQNYQMVEIGGYQVAQLSAEAGFEISSDIGQFGLGKLNNAVFLDGETIAYTTSQPVMEAVIATSLGSVDSILDVDRAAALVAAVPAPLAASTMVSGKALGGESVQRGIQKGEAPLLELALLGQTPGLPLSGAVASNLEGTIIGPDSVVVIALAYDTAADAEDGLQRSLEGISSGVAPSNGRPYSDHFSSWDGYVTDDAIVVLELAPVENPGVWLQMLFRRDLAFLV